MGPHPSSRVDVPCLHLADVVGARFEGKRGRRACEAASGFVFDFAADRGHAEVVVGRNVEQTSLWIERSWCPVLASPQRWAELCQLTRPRLAVGVDGRPPGHRVKRCEHVLMHVRLSFDERDRPVGALQEPEIAVSCRVNESLDCSPVATEVDQDWRGNLIPVPGFVWRVLKVTNHLAGGNMDRKRRSGVEVVPRSLVADPRTTIASPPVRDVRLLVVVPRYPDRPTASLPLIALGPGVTSWLAGRRDSEDAPRFLAGRGVEGRDKPTHTPLATRRTDHDLAARHQRRQRHVVALTVVRHRSLPDLSAGRGVQRVQHGMDRGEVDLVLVERDAPAGRMPEDRVLGWRHPEAPPNGSGLRIKRHHLIVRG